VISITAIPIGTACIVALFTSVLFPWYVSQSAGTRIEVFHPDKRGGLAPIIELLFYATSIFSGGILISFFLFPELYLEQNRLIAYGLFFVVFDLILFFAPQIFIQTVLAKKNWSYSRVYMKRSLIGLIN
jgi:hypothetical protein